MSLHAILVRTVLGPLWEKWEGSPYLRHYRRLKRTQYESPEVIRGRQWEAVQNLLVHCYGSVRMLRSSLDVNMMIALTTRAIGEVVRLD